MTRSTAPRSGSLLMALLMLTLGCSSPTSPTRPPAQRPPGDERPGLSLICPSNQSVTASAASGSAVTFTSPVASGGVTPVQTSCTPASASVFPIGTTTVRCTATDAAQSTSACTFTVTVAAAVPELARTKFLAFGDSMTAGEVTRPTVASAAEGMPHFRLILVPSASYPTQLLSRLRTRYSRQTSQLQVTNAGMPGEWAEDGVKRLPGVLSSSRPEVVLLLEGANELAALGTPGVQRASRAIDTMAREVRSRGVRLFLATVPPTRSTGQNAIALTLIQSLNAMIRTTARGEGAVLVDVYAALSSDPTRYIGPDGLHPTEAGYLKIAETFFAAIREDLER